MCTLHCGGIYMLYSKNHILPLAIIKLFNQNGISIFCGMFFSSQSLKKKNYIFQFSFQGMAALIQNPAMKLESIIDSAKMISDSYEEMSSMIPNCA